MLLCMCLTRTTTGKKTNKLNPISSPPHGLARLLLATLTLTLTLSSYTTIFICETGDI